MYYVTIDMPNICGQELLLLFRLFPLYNFISGNVKLSLEMSNGHFVIKMSLCYNTACAKYSHMGNTVVPYILTANDSCHSH